MVKYKRMREEINDTIILTVEGDKDKVRAKCWTRCTPMAGTSLSESEGKEILKAYGVGVPAEVTARTADDAAKAGRRRWVPGGPEDRLPDIGAQVRCRRRRRRRRLGGGGPERFRTDDRQGDEPRAGAKINGVTVARW